MAGTLITFEGGEGVGKSTQITHLQSRLIEKAGYHPDDIITTREPGGTPAAEKIRDLLSDPALGGTWSDQAELLLLFAARAEHLKDVIRPALQSGKIILCDRYIDSTRIYQGHVRDIDPDFITALEGAIIGDNAIPDVTFILDVPVSTAMERVTMRGGGDHYDQAGEAFFERLRDGFLHLAEEEPTRCIIIDGTQSENIIADQIFDHVINKIGSQS